MKRKDIKGRTLKTGESQITNKASPNYGRYEFVYIDISGKKRHVYSWKLTPADKMPDGKRSKTSLREMEEQITADRLAGIDTHAAKNTTLNDIWDKLIKSRTDLKLNTKNTYIALWNGKVRESIGKRKIAQIKYSDIRQYYIDLFEKGYSKGYLQSIAVKIGMCFDVALKDDLVRKDPSKGVFYDVAKRYGTDPEPRRALTLEEQQAFMQQIREDDDLHQYEPLFTFMLGTGARVGETIGITWKDIDFKNNTISINHNTVQTEVNGKKNQFIITSPKTSAGVRTIPMLQEVRAQLLKQKEKTGFSKDLVIDGFSGFVFQNHEGNLYPRNKVYEKMQIIKNRYNAKENEKAQKEGREPVLIGIISPHILRHTFCTRLCEAETNIKVIQDIMGHQDIKTTMDIYAEVGERKKQQTFKELDTKAILM